LSKTPKIGQKRRKLVKNAEIGLKRRNWSKTPKIGPKRLKWVKNAEKLSKSPKIIFTTLTPQVPVQLHELCRTAVRGPARPRVLAEGHDREPRRQPGIDFTKLRFGPKSFRANFYLSKYNWQNFIQPGRRVLVLTSPPAAEEIGDRIPPGNRVVVLII
jgi:hypothetical protein